MARNELQMCRDHRVDEGDCADVLDEYAAEGRRFDCAIFSPPYEDARMYGGKRFPLKGIDFVAWLSTICRKIVKVVDGPCCCVINGRTSQFEWSGTPFLLWAELKYPGMVCPGVAQKHFGSETNFRLYCRKPLLFHRRGIMGSGGPDYFRDDYELVIVFGKTRRYAFADPLAEAKPPKFPPGGAPSHRKKDGTRVAKKAYKPPALANPGNVISGSVGKGHMGSDRAHKSEAPYPEWLARRLLLWGCKPGGIVLDPFGGSGTTMAVAAKSGRRSQSIEQQHEMCLEIIGRRTEVAEILEEQEAKRKAGGDAI